jgi:hypothetical protein
MMNPVRFTVEFGQGIVGHALEAGFVSAFSFDKIHDLERLIAAPQYGRSLDQDPLNSCSAAATTMAGVTSCRQ